MATKDGIESEKEAVLDLLRLMNRDHGQQELIRDVTVLMREWAGCDAVGIRLREGPDFPYFETRGFPEEHVRLENRLCAVDEEGELLRDSSGNPVLECMCGNVLTGRFDSSLPFFTKSGSFWTNSTSELLASTSEEDRQARTRNRCHGEGYESVVLAPIRRGSEIMGLLQLNDSRKGFFSFQFVHMLERLASSLGQGLKQQEKARQLREREEELAAISTHIPQLVLLVDSERRVQSANPAAALFAGSPAEDLLGRRGGEALGCLRHLDDPRGCGFGPECEQCVVRNIVLATFRRGTSFHQVEASLPVLRQGVREDLALLVSTSFLRHGNKDLVLLILDDISPRKRFENALARKCSEYSLLLDSIPAQVCYFVDADTHGTVNQAYADFLGKKKEEIEYNLLEELLPPEVAFTSREENLRVFKTGEQYSTEKCLVDAQGRQRVFEVVKTTHKDPQGNVDYVVCVGWDVTKVRKMEP